MVIFLKGFMPMTALHLAVRISSIMKMSSTVNAVKHITAFSAVRRAAIPIKSLREYIALKRYEN